MRKTLIRGRSGLFVAVLALAMALAARDASAFEFPKLFGGGDEKGAARAPSSGAVAECPEIVVLNGVMALRTPPDADAASVRHQIALGAMARECVAEGGRLAIKVGIEGAVALGPLGQPGAYSANLRIVVRRIKDQAVLGEKTYRVGATIPAGAARADFSLIADPVSVPHVGGKAADEYEILVGFAQAGGEPLDKPAKPRKQRRAVRAR
jgi:hypothetical protein